LLADVRVCLALYVVDDGAAPVSDCGARGQDDVAPELGPIAGLHTHPVDGQDSSVVLEANGERPFDGRLEPLAVVVRKVP